MRLGRADSRLVRASLVARVVLCQGRSNVDRSRPAFEQKV